MNFCINICNTSILKCDLDHSKEYLFLSHSNALISRFFIYLNFGHRYMPHCISERIYCYDSIYRPPCIFNCFFHIIQSPSYLHTIISHKIYCSYLGGPFEMQEAKPSTYLKQRWNKVIQTH